MRDDGEYLHIGFQAGELAKVGLIHNMVPALSLLMAAGIGKAWADVKAGRTGDVPRELQNVHADSTGMEREQGYLYPHNFPRHWVRQQYLPDALQGVRYYEYGDNKTEQAAKRYWDEIKGPQP